MSDKRLRESIEQLRRGQVRVVELEIPAKAEKKPVKPPSR